jgi:hypothetical protein
VATAQTVGVAKTIWNDTFGTLEFGLKGGNINYRLGQSSIVYVKSADNAGLTKGTVVYTAGSDGINKTVRLAQANAESTSSKTFGIIAETVTGGEKAFCTTFGNIEGINTSAFAEGATIYLSPTVAGGMTTTKPSAPNHMVVVGFCLRSHATQGVIFVKVQNGFELDEIHDVAIGTLANNNLLAYESSTSLWKNKTFAELGIAAGTGTTNFVTKWSNATGGLTNSQIFDNGTNVGIGTSSPSEKLTIGTGAVNHKILIRGTVADVEFGNDTLGLKIGTANNGNIYFTTNAAERLRISNLGNVGIGTDNPSTRLTVAGTVSINTAVQSMVMNSASGVYSTYQHNGTSIGDIGTSNQAFSGGLTADFGITSRAGKLALGTGSVVRMVIDTAGKIGINNLEPTYTLDVSGTIRTTNLLITSGATSGNFLKCNNVNGTSVWSSVTTSDITNLSSFTGFDSRYFTETESDARFVALGGSYSNPTWITSLAWLKLSGVPTTFAPSAHTHAAADIVSGVIAQARLGSGTASATTFLRGDQTWATLPSATQNLDAVLGVGNTAINKQIILNGTNSVFDSAAIMFYKNGAEKGKLHYDNQFVERLRLSSTSIIQIESSVSVGLYGTSTIIGSLSGTGTRMVVADASGVLSTQAIPSGGIGTIDQVLAAGNTSINKSFNMQNGGLFFNSQNGSLVGGISGSSFLDGSPASLSISTATNIMMQITAGSFNVISENVIIGIPNTTGLINLQGTPFNFNENAQNLGMGQNGSQWGADFNQALPQPGDRVVFFWDGTRFVMSHVRTYAGAGGKTYLTID